MCPAIYSMHERFMRLQKHASFFGPRYAVLQEALHTALFHSQQLLSKRNNLRDFIHILTCKALICNCFMKNSGRCHILPEKFISQRPEYLPIPVHPQVCHLYGSSPVIPSCADRDKRSVLFCCPFGMPASTPLHHLQFAQTFP